MNAIRSWTTLISVIRVRRNGMLLNIICLGLSMLSVESYEVACVYPEFMLEPFAARDKLLGFTGVYGNGAPLETPIAIHQAQAFAYCDINCLAHHDDSTLHAFTKERPSLVVPSFGHNSWSRMMCIAQCYSILFITEGNDEAIQTIIDTWKLPIQSTVESAISDYLETNYSAVIDYIASLDYDPLAVGRMVAHEISIYVQNDGWNMNGAMRYDPVTEDVVRCTGNCVPYRDTYGYEPRNHPTNRIDPITKYNVSGSDMYWQPLLEDDGLGYFSRQEFVTPHIGFHAKYKLRDPASVPNLPDPNYDYRLESLKLINHVLDSASNKTKWDMITFYDRKFLVRLMIQEVMKEQFSEEYTFEDELLFVFGLSAAEHDAVLHAWRQKVVHDLVRPPTVIHRWGEDILYTFDGNRKNPGITDSLAARDFQAFIRVMPHSEYPSGSSCMCKSYAEFTDAYTTSMFKRNLSDMYWGYGGVDFGCSELSVEDPIRADFLGCKQGGFVIRDMPDLVYQCSESRLWGGMHYRAAVDAGYELCTGLGSLALDLVETIRNGSDFGGQFHRQKDVRPLCSSRTMTPTQEPILVESTTSPKKEEPSNPIIVTFPVASSAPREGLAFPVTPLLWTLVWCWF